MGRQWSTMLPRCYRGVDSKKPVAISPKRSIAACCRRGGRQGVQPLGPSVPAMHSMPQTQRIVSPFVGRIPNLFLRNAPAPQSHERVELCLGVDCVSVRGTKCVAKCGIRGTKLEARKILRLRRVGHCSALRFKNLQKRHKLRIVYHRPQGVAGSGIMGGRVHGLTLGQTVPFYLGKYFDDHSSGRTAKHWSLLLGGRATCRDGASMKGSRGAIKERVMRTRDPRSGGAQGLDGRYTAWRSGAHGPHAHGNAARQVVDVRRAAEVRGQ